MRNYLLGVATVLVVLPFLVLAAVGLRALISPPKSYRSEYEECQKQVAKAPETNPFDAVEPQKSDWRSRAERVK